MNKRESFWFGSLLNDKKDICRLIPVHETEDPDQLIPIICEWYNSGMPEKEQRVVPEVKNTIISKSLREIENMFGAFPLQAATRIQNYLDDPCIDRWDDICGIIIDGNHTLWQCVLQIDPSFPKQGRSTDITGKIVEEWSKIPSSFEVLRAIKEALIQKKAMKAASAGTQ